MKVLVGKNPALPNFKVFITQKFCTIGIRRGAWPELVRLNQA